MGRVSVPVWLIIPLVGLVFPAIAMASLFLYVQKNKIV